MENKAPALEDKILKAALIFLIALFAFSLFKNIAYPLLWNDEAETAMFAERVLEYGYPKVHDGKNTVYLAEIPQGLGIDEKTDAYRVTTWGQYYFCVPGILLAELTGDIYAKTALLRIPFALAGFAGLVIFALSVSAAFGNDRPRKFLFLSLFAFFELLSVALVLHLKEVRHPSLTILLSSCVIHVYFRYSVFKKIKTRVYALSMPVLLFLLFNVFSPAYFIFLAAIGLNELAGFAARRRSGEFVSGLSPLLVSLVLTAPLFYFFRTFSVSAAVGKVISFDKAMMGRNIAFFLDYFMRHEFLPVFFVVEFALLAVWVYGSIPGKRFSRAASDFFGYKMRVSVFLGIFLLAYFFLIAGMRAVLFQRYYIFLQPVLMAKLLLDIFIIRETAGSGALFGGRRFARLFLTILAGLFFLFARPDKAVMIINRIYELSHRYKGPLDFAIPYIMSVYKDTGKIVIATNYEECSYMYYLRCRAIMGYARNNLAGDMKETPDVIIFRKGWYMPPDFRADGSRIKSGGYKKVSLPVLDSFVNNIPETTRILIVSHFFETPVVESDDACLDIYLKK